MPYRTRIKYTAEQKAEMWDRWQRSRLALTLSEREEISRGVASHESLRSIATRLERSPSTLSREVKRNEGYDYYRAAHAAAAWNRAQRPKLCKLARNRPLSRTVAAKLQLSWSPEQIAGWLKREYPKEENNQVSHEAIYRSLFVQARGVLKKELLQYLRTRRAIRRSKHASLKGSGLGQITNTVSIRERPASAEDHAVLEGIGRVISLRAKNSSSVVRLSLPFMRMSSCLRATKSFELGVKAFIRNA